MSGLSPNESAIRIDDQLARQIGASSAEEIKSLMRQAALEQGLATAPDPWHPEELVATEKAFANPEAKQLVRTRTINGTEYEISGDSTSALDEAELELHRRLQAAPEEQPRDQETGRFISAEQQAANAELELRFKRGDISVDDYLAQSGAIERHLQAQGIDVASLREVSGRGFTQRWSDASTTFRERHPEWGSYASQTNMTALGEKIIALGLEDSPSIESLEAAYAALVRESALRENPNVAVSRQIAGADNIEDIRSLGRAALGLPANGFFNR